MIPTLSANFAPLTRPNVALIGKAESSRLDAPYGHPEWEIWGLSDAVSYVGEDRWHRWFELHDLTRYHETYPIYWDWLTAHHQGRPIYIGRADDPRAQQIPEGNPWPVDDMVAKYGRYFTNSVSYMLATAIELGAEQIALYGIDMACDEVNNAEYGSQRPSCEYFIGLGRGKGINVYVPPQSDLLKTGRLYGIEANRGEMDRKLRTRTQWLADQKRRADIARRNERQTLHLVTGAKEYAQHLAAQFPNDETLQATLGRSIQDLTQRAAAQAIEVEHLDAAYHRLDGAAQDLKWASQWA